ncbi:hypothetical protein HU200_049960 [Digitaria exilis]|uniref:Uncharacterized protein n=1 Tax=Digitaria exilis TaxID=1010633 RepID=A0A835AP69_9POAL|nr:hypothetical protein HU200_049960 [Digitaria exilis]
MAMLVTSDPSWERKAWQVGPTPPTAVALGREIEIRKPLLVWSATKTSREPWPPPAAAGAEQEKELLSSVVSDIRCYFRLRPTPPMAPVLHRPALPASISPGMRKMERALPPATLHEKLPRFLQKAPRSSRTTHAYRDDHATSALPTNPPIAAISRLDPLLLSLTTCL